MKSLSRDFKTLINHLIILFLLINSLQGHPTAKIIGGVEAERGEFPWLVSIKGYTNATETFRHVCGGTIVSKNRVATGAHCVIPFKTDEIRIVAGVHNINKPGYYQQIVQALSVTKHSEYDGILFRNDIAILEVYPAFEETTRVKIVQMPNSNTVSTGLCTIAGWGWTSEMGPDGSDVLLKVDLPIVPKDRCGEIYPENFHAETQMCTGRKEGGLDACVGDTGGALICDDLGYKYFAGIASWGYMCARPDKPAVYTEVSSFINWIQSPLSTSPELPEFDIEPLM